MDRERGRVRDGGADEENEAERVKVREGERKRHERDRKTGEKNKSVMTRVIPSDSLVLASLPPSDPNEPSRDHSLV